MRKYIVYLLLAAFGTAVIVSLLYLRSEGLEEKLRGLLTETIESLTSEKATIDRVSINPLMFSADISGFRLRDERGVIAEFKRARLYISPFELIKKRLIIKRLVVYKLRVKRDIGGLIPLFKKSRGSEPSVKKKDSKQWKLFVRSASLRDASVVFNLPKGGLNIGGLYMDVNLSKGMLKVKRAEYEYPGLEGTFKAKALLKKGKVFLRDVYIDDRQKSQVEFDGSIAKEEGLKGNLRALIKIKTLSSLFEYLPKGKGQVKLNGSIKTPVLKGRAIKELIRGSLFALNIEGELFVQDLFKIIGVKEPIYGKASFRGAFKGSLSEPDLTLKVKEKEGRIYGVKVEHLETDFRLKDRRVVFENAQVRALGGRAKVYVQFLLPEVRWYQIKIVAERLDSERLLRLINWDPGMRRGRIRGMLYFSGTRFVPSGYFEYERTDNRPPEKSPVQGVKEVKGYFRKFGDSLFLRNMLVKTEKTVAQGGGFLNLKDRTVMMDVTVKTASLRELFLRDDTSGRATIKGGVYGRIERPVLKGELKLSDGLFMGIPVGNVKGRLSYNVNTIQLQNLVGQFEEGSYSLSGLIYTGSQELFVVKRPLLNLLLKTNNLYIKRFSSLAPVPEGLSGRVDGVFRVEGSPTSPNISSTINAHDVSYRGFGPGTVKTELFVNGKDMVFRGLTLKKGASVLSGGLIIKDEKLSSEGLSLTLFTSDFPKGDKLPEGILIKGIVDLSGNWQRPTIKLDSDILLKNRKTGGLINAGVMDILFEDFSSLNAQVSLFGGINLLLKGSFDERFSWDANFNIRDSKYEEYIRLIVDHLPEDFTFTLSGKGKLRADDGRITGRMELKHLQMSMLEQNIISQGPVDIEVKDGSLIIDSMKLKAGTSTTTITGLIDLKRGYDLTLYGVAYLAPLQPFLKGVNYLMGRAEFVLGITGSFKSPVLNGDMTISDGALSLSGLPGRFYRLKGYLYLYRNRVVLEELQGLYSQGSLVLKGSAILNGTGALDSLSAELALKGVELNPVSGLDMTVSGSLTMSSQDGGYNVLGDLKVLKAVLRKDINWRALVIKSMREKAMPAVEVPTKINMNIALYGDRDIKIKTNIVEGDGVVDVVVVGSPQRPSLLGRIELSKGRIFFRNNEFTIRHASADFIREDSIYPYFSVNAETRVRDYNITLVLDGYIDEFDLSLISDPPLDEVDILSLLMLGRLSGELKGMEGGIGASEATAFLTGEFQQTIQERIKSLTGFDRIELEPYVSETSGSIAPRLTVSKRLLGDRLYLTYSTLLGDTTEQLIKMEMRVTDSISLIGERDETGGVGADIRFRMRFK